MQVNLSFVDICQMSWTSSQKSESDKEEESFLEEAEDFGKEVVVRLAEEEAISFIKLALIAII